jgi:hypothetical protein
MKQEELMKERILQGVTRIYQRTDVATLLAQQIVGFMGKIEGLLEQ